MGKARCLIYILVTLFALGSFTACGQGDSGTRVVFTTGLDQDEVFRIGSITCTMPEFMVYLTNTQNQYENVYGEEIWNIQVDEITLEQNVKDTVLAKLAQIKTMYLLAQEKGVELTEAELQRVETAAEEYFASLSEIEIEYMGITQETIRQLYEEYAMADKVFETIIADVNPEISDDEARTIIVQHIMIKTYTTDGSGKRIEYLESMRQQCFETAQAVRAMAVDGEHSFTDLAAEYSQDDQIQYSIRQGEMPEVLEAAAFNLGTGEVSEIVESEDGYHILKCISTFDREETDANKMHIIEQRKKEAFGREYDAFVGTLIRDLNEKLLEEITLIRDEEVDTDSFFDVYHKYL